MSTQSIPFSILKKVTLNYPKSAAMKFSSQGLENKFETAVVNEPSVFEPLKFNCIHIFSNTPRNTWVQLGLTQVNMPNVLL